MSLDNALLESLVFRRARWSDASRVGLLVRELAGEMQDAAVVRRFRRFLLLPGYSVFLYLDGERAIGMWIGRKGYFLGADVPYIQPIGLVVDPEYRGRGVASDLFLRCPRLGDYCQLWFVTQHEHLHGFYEGLGCSVTGSRFVKHLERSPNPSFKRRLMRRAGL